MDEQEPREAGEGGGDCVPVPSPSAPTGTYDTDGATDDDEGPSYAEGFEGMNAAYNDIQAVFQEVARDYPEVFYGDSEDESKSLTGTGGQGDAAGDSGLGLTEQQQQLVAPEAAVKEPAKLKVKQKTEKLSLGLGVASVPKLSAAAATKSPATHHRPSGISSQPVLQRSRSKPPQVTSGVTVPKKPEVASTRNKRTLSKGEPRFSAATITSQAKAGKKQVLPRTLSKGPASTSSGALEKKKAKPKAKPAEEVPSISKIDLRPLPRSEPVHPSRADIVSRRTDAVPHATDEAVHLSSTQVKRELWPIKEPVARPPPILRPPPTQEPSGDWELIRPAGRAPPTALLPPLNKEGGFEPGSITEEAYSRMNTVFDCVPHDDFAAEFIREAGKKSELAILGVLNEEAELSGARIPKLKEPKPKTKPKTAGPQTKESSSGSEGEDTDEEKEPQRKPHYRAGDTSMKLVYTPPVWPYQTPIYETLSRLPALRSLSLDDSKLHWLRDLGSSLPNLITLSVMRCGLVSLDGVWAMPNLENLFATDNKISNPSPLSHLNNLRFLDLSDNPIRNFEGFAFLSVCTNLRCIKLMDTKVSRYRKFHIEMCRLIPSLRELQPKSVALHGPGVFELYHFDEDEDSLEEDNDTIKFADNPFSSLRPIAPDTKEHIIVTTKATPVDAVPVVRTTGLKWRDEEKRLRRNISNLDRELYKKRGVEVCIPMNVDEMDAYLDELELAEGIDSLFPPPDSQEAEILAAQESSISAYTEAAENHGLGSMAESSASSQTIASLAGLTETTSGIGPDTAFDTTSNFSFGESYISELESSD